VAARVLTRHGSGTGEGGGERRSEGFHHPCPLSPWQGGGPARTSSSGAGGGGVARCTATPRRPPRTHGLGRGRTNWHVKCRFCPYPLVKPQVCHRVSLLALTPYTTDETWAVTDVWSLHNIGPPFNGAG
jgi:hypothetical protein